MSDLTVGHASPLDGKAIAETDTIFRLAARIAKLEKQIYNHNKRCDDTCKIWRENKACWHKRQCPDCPKDWKIEE